MNTGNEKPLELETETKREEIEILEEGDDYYIYMEGDIKVTCYFDPNGGTLEERLQLLQELEQGL